MSTSKAVVKNSQDNQTGKITKFSTTHKNFAITTKKPSKDSEVCDIENTTQNMSRTGIAFTKPCTFCQETHTMDMCKKKYITLSLKDRYTFLKSKGLCFGCLRSGHLKSNCQRKLSCVHCKKLHPSVLHVDPQKKNEGYGIPSHLNSGNGATALSVAAHMEAGDSVKQALPIVPVRLKSKCSDKYLTTYAFLDSGSNATFCLESLTDLLNVEGKRTKLNLVTMGQEKVHDSYVICGLEVSDLNGDNTIELPPVFTQSTLPVSKKDVISLEDVKRWPHLHGVELNVIDCDIGLLIGVNVPKALEPWEIIPSASNGPFAVKTLLGWVINGPLEVITNNDNYSTSVSVDRIDVRKLEEQIRDQFNYDFSERTIDDVYEPSKNDRKFLERVSNSIRYENGHHTIGLPFKYDNVSLPNNRKQAVQRLSFIAKRFNRDKNFHKEYCDFMDKIISEGYAVKVPAEELGLDDGRVWYLPHHGVYHPKKRKLRVVFDCAARYQGTSLNDQLLPGPNLTNTLVGTLLRFRQEEIAVMGDIDSMFHQVHLPRQDASFHRFLWWMDGDTSKQTNEYQMVVHFFGASSSPSCANYALRKTAKDSEGLFDTEVIDTVIRNFYVDDCLKSVKTVDDAVSLVKDLQKLLMKGGFHIAKWISNNRDVMMSIPVSERAKEVKDLDLDHDTLPMERALGVQWCVESDAFCFKIEVKEQPLTRKGILSMISSVFDPLGFLAPFVLRAKKILQNFSKLQLGWDDEIPENLAIQWNNWFSDLQKLSNFTIERCIKPVGFGTLCSVQLHHFADASEIGYGTVSYLRLENTNKEIHCSFIMGRSRVTPLKQTTIPRLELTAATVAVRTDKMLKAELDIPIDESMFWTDSTTVLRYIGNETSRFQTFVANRLTVIHEGSRPCEWHYINTKLNPADYASRGLSADEIIQHDYWIKAPYFLWAPAEQWPKTPPGILEGTTDVDPEVKACVRAAVANIQKPSDVMESVNKLLNYHSSWYTLRKSVAWILKIRKELLRRIQQRIYKSGDDESSDVKVPSTHYNMGHISFQDLTEAETAILSYVQHQTFADELHTLADKHSYVKRSSCIRKLDSVLDKNDGLLHVGGRLHRASMPAESKHPIILPSNHHVSSLILRQIHHDLKHSGRNHTLAALRERYWLIHAPSAIRKLISKCTVCRHLGSKVGEQKMASLPEDRLIPNEPPVTRVGVDYFGPLEVKQKRSHVKRYGVIFTCLACRAVHIEVAASLTTDSYINAMRRFIARRGQVIKIRSDNGTNFVRAERELARAINDWNLSQIQDSMLQRNIDWQFNPPAGSRHGGVWERVIRSIRKVMNSVLRSKFWMTKGFILSCVRLNQF
ncbi:uncharacterized protein LOC125664373 [Ostrea edulis]|uniref:uncharacterized protein LOC125664373 n=1 Tax=Ostrea edulis TaxID=37623 RepID=UPI0024AF042D|nr:uncharacterized protein LOC125664373 [Ostrea edulis]